MSDLMVLLPPSETKTRGGELPPVDLDDLAFADQQRAAREQVTTWLETLCKNHDRARQVLGLTAKQAEAIHANAELTSARTMLALERYTGVLYSALHADDLSTTARSWSAAHVYVQSALWGIISVGDSIPEYRLSAGLKKSALDLGAVWHEVGSAVLADSLAAGRVVLDLRSKAYAALAPLPHHEHAVWVEVVTRSADGATRALNHFNKQAKGQLVRALAEHGDKDAPANGDVWSDVRAAAATFGAEFELGAPGSAQLII